jgi:hypothetical protein
MPLESQPAPDELNDASANTATKDDQNPAETFLYTPFPDTLPDGSPNPGVAIRNAMAMFTHRL